MATTSKSVSNTKPKPIVATRKARGLRQGLYSDNTIVLGESREEYEELRAGFIDSLAPLGTLEHAIVDKITFNIWRNRRLARAELKQRIDSGADSVARQRRAASPLERRLARA